MTAPEVNGRETNVGADAEDESAPEKLRINVVALISEDIVGKFLVVVEEIPRVFNRI